MIVRTLFPELPKEERLVGGFWAGSFKGTCGLGRGFEGDLAHSRTWLSYYLPLVNAKSWKTTVEAAVSPDGGGPSEGGCPPPFLTHELQVLPTHRLLLPSY